MPRLLTTLIAGLAWATQSHAQPMPPRAILEGLGNPQQGYVSRALDVSSNGRVVVGHNELDPHTNGFIVEQAFTWNDATGQIPLEFLPGIPQASSALGVSANGLHAVGRSTSENAPYGLDEAVRWSRGFAPLGLGSLTDFSFTEATATSGDGGVVVGTNQFVHPVIKLPPLYRAFRWTESSMTDLGALTPTGDSFASDVSRAGDVIVGKAFSPLDPSNPLIREGFSHEPIVWTADGDVRGLGHFPYTPTDVPDGYLDTYANAVSADGRFVVGASTLVLFNGQPDLVHRAFIWSAADGIVDLGDLPIDLCCFEYDAVDVSANGKMVVGNTTLVTSDPELTEPFLWTPEQGVRFLLDALISDYGFTDLEGWQLGEVAAISDNGNAIVGTGINPDGEQEAWRIRLQRSRSPLQSVPEPAGMGLWLGCGLVWWLVRLRRRRLMG